MKNYRFNFKKASAIFFALALGAMVNAQTEKAIEDFKPSETNQPGQSFPQVNSEKRVRVQI